VSRYVRTWTASVDYVFRCADCGAWVADPDAHDLWHTALDDIWSWVDRVSGDSCKVARAVWGYREPKGKP
jgi:hypothetical protein